MTIDTSTEAVKRLLEDVTRGPWTSNSLGEFGPVYYGEDQANGMICEPVGRCEWPNTVDNARFIAAARDLVPALLAERDRARLTCATTIQPVRRQF